MITTKKYCKKLLYKINPEQNPITLLGQITNQDEHFIYFQTQKNHYTIGKTNIIYITNTDIPFKNGEEE